MVGLFKINIFKMRNIDSINLDSIIQKSDSKDSIKLHRIFPLIFAIFGAFNIASAITESDEGRRSGFIANFNIGVHYLDYKVGNTNLRGVETSIFGTLGWIFRDYVKAEISLGTSGAPLRASGEYPVGLSKNLNSPGVITKDITSFKLLRNSTKVGLNILAFSKNWGHSIYLNIGNYFDVFAHNTATAAYSSVITNTDMFIEIEGNKKLNDKLRFEYIASGGISYADLGVSNNGKIFNSSSMDMIGYNAAFSLGLYYKVGKKAHFFTRANVFYRYLSAGSDTFTITTPTTNTDNQTLLPNESATMRYPQSHSLYSGISFGFGF